jgi:hypothetical protein
MPKKKPQPLDEKPQRERFIEAARKAGFDEAGEAFERAFARIVPPKRAGRNAGESSVSPRTQSNDGRASKRRNV